MKGLYEFFYKDESGLIRLDKYFTLYQRNIQSLAIELFKVKQNVSGSMFDNIFRRDHSVLTLELRLISLEVVPRLANTV